MSHDEIIFKGYKNRLTVVLNTEKSFEQIKNDFIEKLNRSQKFFEGIKKTCIEFKGCNLSVNQKLDLLGIFSCQTKSQTFLIDRELNQNYEAVSQEKKHKGRVEDVQSKKALFFDLSDNAQHEFNFEFKSMISNTVELKSVLYKNSIRGGQSIHYDGTVVIIGDVNPGAEVISTGNILVMGKIKGLVHAGCNGDKSSIITALGLSRIQIRIGDVISCMPENKTISVPSCAYIIDDRLCISPLSN